MNRVATVFLALALASGGCAAQGSPTGGPGDGPIPVERDVDGKGDNYISTNAREFELLGEAHAELPEGYLDLAPGEREQELGRAIDDRMSTISGSVRRHIDAVLEEVNDGERGEDARYFTYFKRDHAETEEPDVLEDGAWVRFGFRVQLVGSNWLMSKLAPEESAHRTFVVEVADYGEDEGEPVEIEIRGSESRDAFPRYDELFTDGVYDIAVHFGGDYNEERFDLETARWLVDYLREGGWQNEAVATLDDMTLESRPFTRPMLIEGREVEARVYVYHSDMVPEGEEDRLADTMRRSFSERDVVIYSGHAGEGAGFLLDYQPRYELRADDFAELPMADKYQIFVFDGCRTYRSYVDDMMENPNKTFENVDIVTTVNTTPFSAGYQTLHEFIYWLTITSDTGQHYPVSWMGILRGINVPAFSSVHYGVHGIDEDPQLNPYASEGIACQPCETDADCGAGGNFCLDVDGTGAGRCGVACTTDTACGRGSRCARLFDIEEYFYLPKQCIPRDYSCD